MGANLDLDLVLREVERRNDPPTFTLHERGYKLPVTISMEAHAILAAAPERADDEAGWLQGINGFIDSMLTGPDRTAWRKVSKDLPVEVYERLILHISNEYVGRPSVPSIDSSAGPPQGGRRSNSGRSKRGSATSAA